MCYANTYRKHMCFYNFCKKQHKKQLGFLYVLPKCINNSFVVYTLCKKNIETNKFSIRIEKSIEIIKQYSKTTIKYTTHCVKL